MKKRLLSLLLALSLLCTSKTVTFASTENSQVEVSDDYGTMPLTGDTVADASEYFTVGRAKYRLYTYTLLLSNCSEAHISFSVSSYTSGTTESQKTEIKLKL